MNMKEIVQKLNMLLKRVKGSRRRPFPKTMKDLDQLANEVCELVGVVKSDAYVSLVAQSMLHKDINTHTVSPLAIAREIDRATANQLAYSVIHEIKQREKDAANDKPVQN